MEPSSGPAEDDAHEDVLQELLGVRGDAQQDAVLYMMRHGGCEAHNEMVRCLRPAGNAALQGYDSQRQARMLCRRFSEDDWEVLRSRVRRLGRSGSPVTGPLLAADKGSEAEGQREAESVEQDVAHEHQTAPMLLNRLVQRFLTPSLTQSLHVLF